MSLDWNLTNIADHKNVCYITATEDEPTRGVKKGERILRPETEALIWLTLITGVGWGITEDNVDEFVARVQFYEKMFGPMVTKWDEEQDAFAPAPLDEDTIRAHIGLHTNVPYEARDKWLERMFRQAYPKTAPGGIGGKSWYVTVTNPEDELEIEVTAPSREDAVKKARGKIASDFGYFDLRRAEFTAVAEDES